MSDINRGMEKEKRLREVVNEIGGLVIRNCLSYNQAQKVFDQVLEGLKDVPYQSIDSIKE